MVRMHWIISKFNVEIAHFRLHTAKEIKNFVNLVYNYMSQKCTVTKMFSLSLDKGTVQTYMHECTQ